MSMLHLYRVLRVTKLGLCVYSTLTFSASQNFSVLAKATCHVAGVKPELPDCFVAF